MNYWQATILGIVEGLTEFLPVSSTGHLLLTQRMMEIPKNAAADAYAICIQSGAILAVAGLYFHRIREMFRGVLDWLMRRATWANNPGRSLAVNLAIAFLPAPLLGVPFGDWIERRLFGLWYVVAAWLVGGVAILVLTHWQRRRGGEHAGFALEQLTWTGALAIGAFQCLALWPGTSRSLVTILGAMLVGMSLSAAVEFSFLLGMMTLLAATAYKLLDTGSLMVATYPPAVMLVGSLGALGSAWLAMRWMVAYLRRHGLELFGYYRIGLAILVGGLLWLGWLAP